MKILFLSKFGQGETIDSDFIPRIGDSVDLFYRPYPRVMSVLAFPSGQTKKEMGISIDVQMIISVE